MLRVRVVLITAMNVELERWVQRLPLNESAPFPEGAEPSRPPLRLSRDLRVLGLTSGMGPTRAAASLAALGRDARWDLTTAYFVVAGIAGVDPEVGSIGSVLLARYLISLGNGHYLDGVGHVPIGRDAVDYTPPLPSAASASARGRAFELTPSLVGRAFALCERVQLRDSPRLATARQGYQEPAARTPPKVALGDSATGETFWAGRASTAWARNQTLFWSGGKAQFAVTQMEDAAYADALSSLARASPRPLANASRLLVLRSASDYTYPPGSDAGLRDWFFHVRRHRDPNPCTAAPVGTQERPSASRLTEPQPPRDDRVA